MSIHMDLIAKYLTELEFNFEQKSDNIIQSGFSDEKGEHVATVFELDEDGVHLKITCWSEENLKIESCDDLVRAEIYKWMLHQNYKMKLGNWEYDPIEHDNHFAIEVAIEDGSLTFNQFKRYISVIFTISRDMSMLKKVIEGMSHEEAIELEEKDRTAAMKEKLQAMLKALEDASSEGESDVFSGI